MSLQIEGHLVRADRLVGTFSTITNLSGESSWTTVSVPSPLDANAEFVAGSNPLASTPSPITGVAITFPVSALTTAIILLSQPAKRRQHPGSCGMPFAGLRPRLVDWIRSCKQCSQVTPASLPSRSSLAFRPSAFCPPANATRGVRSGPGVSYRAHALQQGPFPATLLAFQQPTYPPTRDCGL